MSTVIHAIANIIFICALAFPVGVILVTLEKSNAR